MNLILAVRGRSFAGGGARSGFVFALFVLLSLAVAALLVVMQACGEGEAMPSTAGNSGIPVALVSSLLSGAVIFCERLFPFTLFSRRDPPPVVQFVARYIPSMVIAILVIYSLKDLNLGLFPFGIPSFAGIAATLLLNFFFKNYMLTIFGATALFMVLGRLL